MPKELKKDKKYVQIKNRANFYDAGYQYVYWKHNGNNTTHFIIDHLGMTEDQRNPIMHRIYDTVMPMKWQDRPNEKELEKCYKDVVALIKKVKGDKVSVIGLSSIHDYIIQLERCMACSEEASARLRKMIPDRASIAIKFPVPFLRLTWKYMPKYKVNSELKRIADLIDRYCNIHKVVSMEEDEQWWAKLK